MSAPGLEIYVAPAVERVIDDLRGKRLGLGDALRELARDPCSAELDARRLSGPLAPIVCGIHLSQGYRLAFSVQPQTKVHTARVVVLYVGKRDTRRRVHDIWDVLHDLFGVENPPDEHHRPPCCEDGMPSIGETELDDFMDRLRRLLRGRKISSTRD
ncbi:MAG TPA: hypothetical protein VIJ50_02955 [Solirubrobacteraceae bacterium]